MRDSQAQSASGSFSEWMPASARRRPLAAKSGELAIEADRVGDDAFGKASTPLEERRLSSW